MMHLAPTLARITIIALPLYGIRFAIGPIPSTVLEVFILATLAVWGIEKLQTKQPIALPKKPILILSGVFLAAATVSMFIAPDLRAAAGIWRAYFVEPILFFLVVTDLLKSKRLTRAHIIQSFAATALGLSLYAIVQRITGVGIPAPWAAERRVTSVFSYPNAVGLFLAPLIPLLLTQVSNKHPLRTTYYILTTLASLLAIVFAHSTGALIGVIGGVSIGIVVYLLKTKRWIWLAVVLVVSSAVVAFALSKPALKNELLLRDWSGTVHKIGWRESYAMLKDRPILGAGLSGFKTTVAPYHKATAIEIFQYPHNIILNFWSETGIVGAAAFFALVGYFLYVSLSTGKKPIVYRAALIASMAAIIIHGLVDVPYFKNDLAMVFWLLYSLNADDN